MVSHLFRQAGMKEVLIHTGQHYDPEMSEVFWKELGLPAPLANLDCGTNADGRQTERMLQRLRPLLQSLRPSAVLVYGDTNSALAGALAATEADIPLIHVEAGLRSYNMDMPEERNRVKIDQLASLLFCSSEEGRANLSREGITEHVVVSGDVMVDAFRVMQDYVKEHTRLEDLLPFPVQPYILATVHRPSNTDNPEHMQAIVSAFEALPWPVFWPLHPRNEGLRSAIKKFKNIYLAPPLGYIHMQAVLQGCYKVCTDSGGLQKEAYWAKKPCITLRKETEWTETLHHGWNRLCGTDSEAIVVAVKAEVDASTWKPLYGEEVAGVIVEKIREFVQ